MKALPLRPSVAELLQAEDYEPLELSEIFSLFAAAGIQDGGTPPDELGLWCAANSPRFSDEAELAICLELLCDDMVTQPFGDSLAAHTAWLEGVEELALAQRATEALGEVAPWLSVWSTALSSALASARQRLADMPVRWVHAGRAALAREQLGELLPWSEVSPGARDWSPEAGSAHAALVFEAWGNAALHDDDDASIRSACGESGAWQDAYRAFLSARLSAVYVTRWNPAWSPEIAIDVAALDRIPPVFAVPLPHRGTGVHLEVRVHAEGTCWRDSTASEHGELVPWGTRSHALRDPVLGTLTVAIEEAVPEPLHNTWHAVCALNAIADGADGEQCASHLSVALAVIEDLRCGALQDGLMVGSILFERGVASAAADCLWVSYALQARLALGAVASQLGEPTLDAALLEVDQILRPYGAALWLLDDDEYDMITRDSFVDGDEWWGHRSAVDGALPLLEVDDALREAAEQMRTGGPGPEAPPPLSYVPPPTTQSRLLRLAASDQQPWDMERLVADCYSRPCPWLHQDLHAAASVLLAPQPGTDDLDNAHRCVVTRALKPRSGRVPVLLWEEITGTGVLAELRLTLAPGAGLWGRESWLQPVAWQAIRVAFAAVSCLMPKGLPRYALTDHKLEIRTESRGLVEIDGGSLALPAALAFASLWLEVAVPADLAATGRLHALQLPQAAAVLPVAGVATKAVALSEHFGEQPRARILVHPDNAGQVEQGGATAVSVEGLSAALLEAGLAPEGARFAPALGGTRERRKRLNDLIDHVDAQLLDDYQGLPGVSPWVVLGDELQLVVGSLVNEPNGDTELLGKARARAALAYTHAGESSSAAAAIRDIQLTTDTPQALRVISHIIELGHLIDVVELACGDDWEPCSALGEQLAADTRQLREADRIALLGWSLGTQGRALMHQRKVEDALPMLRSAVRTNAEHLKHELGRSRVYMAMALRMAGQFELAESELDHADGAIVRFTHPYDSTYASSCTMYAAYERARLLVEMDRGDEALAAAELAVSRARYLGWWPALGTLRAKAWALQLLGRAADAAACVAAMRDFDVPEYAQPMATALIREASGPPRTGGVVY